MNNFGILDLSGIPLAVEPDSRTPSTSMQLWPNPAQRVVQVAGLPAGQPLQFYDALGRLALTLPAPRGSAQVQLPPSLKPGVYIVRCGPATRRLVVE
ncbi:T9SS type A sorting domain-containing protein [Hymenobacter sp. J193]|uniref:T9SS type A sorting domain-containing protein n=1 Tax=Hymenobacter sp. J193 TaxID=2898429 RepID=UPI002150F71F|nr:T9SS type A sorting domain-containing protein [Hymenobacter sp. J193]MCR5889899.1 T9SS type A sorting domain-containing protein [Hymenobacter sp. J193]